MPQPVNAEETEGEWFYEDLQDLLEPTPKKDVLFITGEQNAKVGSQETSGVIGKFGPGYEMKHSSHTLVSNAQNSPSQSSAIREP